MQNCRPPLTDPAQIIAINGIVQGVGFRPFVFRLAERYKLRGRVANNHSGVYIHIEGPMDKIDAFVDDISSLSPPLAQIDGIKRSAVVSRDFKTFEITKSDSAGKRATLISPDIAACDDCVLDIRSADNRRYRYPFTNCTNCGPRYTIVEDLPYDRSNTSMRAFTMCPACDNEYNHVYDRRFHAQPNACAQCGPRVSLYDHQGLLVKTETSLQAAVKLLKQGCIVAVKGIGGFHLAANAELDDTILRLRQLKNRPDKPFAVMSKTLVHIQQYANFRPLEKKGLLSRQRPIMLLLKKKPFPLSALIAPGNKFIGCMLPYTPLHDLLFDESLKTLVMTSGNLSGEPIAVGNEEAFGALAHIAEYFLIHDRNIVTRNDDSVVLVTAGKNRLIRRSRGYVPAPIYLKNQIPPILACGPEQKNTVCLTKQNLAFLSQHLGNVNNLKTYAVYKETVMHLQRVLGIEPEVIAYDTHPDYLTSAYALENTDVSRKIAIQHHHAHVVSCMVENQVEGPVIGVALDGTGYGSDGAVWGGEVMIAQYDGFERIGHLDYVAMPGSGVAVKEPWRMAASWLWKIYGENLFDLNLPLFDSLPAKKIELLGEMIKKKINSPLTSSMGRLFDSVAAIVGIRFKASFEGQAAVELESTAQNAASDINDLYDYGLEYKSLYTILIEPMIRAIVQDVTDGVGINVICAKFHNTIIHLVVDLCDSIRKTHGLNRVVLSGGVFQNRILLQGLLRQLEICSFQTYSHTLVPTNDGGISLGQAVIAASLVK